MDIQSILDNASAQLQGTNALIQIQVNDKYYTRRIGDVNRLIDNPQHIETTDNRQFLGWMEEEINKANIANGTFCNHVSTLSVLRQFRPDFTFSDLNYKLICDFDCFLRQRRYAINTIAKFMKIFKRYVNVAIDNEMITNYPFRKYKIKMEETHKNALTERELKKIENKAKTEVLTEEERIVANGFLFSVYSGLRYSDIKQCTKQHIKNLNRTKWLIMRMQKTAGEVRVPLSKMFCGHAVELVKSISTTTGKLFQLPCNSRTNIVLSKILKRFGIHKHISFHCARHTTATILLHRGVNLPTIQHILGHKSIKTTQIYSAVTDSTIYKDIKRGFRVV